MSMSTAPQMFSTLPASQEVRDESSIWHVLVLAAGLTLAVLLFLPVFDAPHGEPLNMMRADLYIWWNDPGMPGDHLFFAFCGFVACHVFGGLMAVSSTFRLIGRQRPSRALSTVLAILLALVGAGLLWTAPISHGLALHFGDRWSLTSTAIAGLAVLAYVIWASRLGPRALPCYEFAAGVAAVSYLAYMCIYSVAVYGTYVALAAGALLLVGIVGAAGHVSRSSWWRTASQLVTCRLQGANQPRQNDS